MKFSIGTGPMVGAHNEQCRTNNAETAIDAMHLRGVRDDLFVCRLNRLCVGETLRFDTDHNTGVSVTKISAR